MFSGCKSSSRIYFEINSFVYFEFMGSKLKLKNAEENPKFAHS